MTQIDYFEHKCPICSKTSEYPVLVSSNRMGYPDLDMRPPAMYRDTMDTWISECPHCGYVSNDFEKTPSVTEDFLKTNSYQSCDGFDFKSKLAARFYRHYLISTSNEDKYFAAQCCVWACDDAEDELALEIRKLEIKIVEDLIDEEPENKTDLCILKSDLMRRARLFDEMINEYELEFHDLYRDIIEFEIKKAYLRDDNCYTVEDVIQD